MFLLIWCMLITFWLSFIPLCIKLKCCKCAKKPNPAKYIKEKTQQKKEEKDHGKKELCLLPKACREIIYTLTKRDARFGNSNRTFGNTNTRSNPSLTHTFNHNMHSHIFDKNLNSKWKAVGGGGRRELYEGKDENMFLTKCGVHCSNAPPSSVNLKQIYPWHKHTYT